MAPVRSLFNMGTLPQYSVSPRRGAGLLAAVPVVRAGVKLVDDISRLHKIEYNSNYSSDFLRKSRNSYIDRATSTSYLVRGDEGDVAFRITSEYSALEPLLFELVGFKKSLQVIFSEI